MSFWSNSCATFNDRVRGSGCFRGRLCAGMWSRGLVGSPPPGRFRSWGKASSPVSPNQPAPLQPISMYDSSAAVAAGFFNHFYRNDEPNLVRAMLTDSSSSSSTSLSVAGSSHRGRPQFMIYTCFFIPPHCLLLQSLPRTMLVCSSWKAAVAGDQDRLYKAVVRRSGVTPRRRAAFWEFMVLRRWVCCMYYIICMYIIFGFFFCKHEIDKKDTLGFVATVMICAYS